MKAFILLAFLVHAYAVEVAHPVVDQQPAVPVVPIVPVVGEHQHTKEKLPEEVKQFINKHIDHIVTHVNVHRVPQQVLEAHLASQQKDKVQQVGDKVHPVPQVPGHVQQIVEHAHTHIPQVINQHVVGNKVQRVMEQVPHVGNDKVPHVSVPVPVQQVVEQVHTHIPQVINEHITTHVVGKVPQGNEKVPQVVAGMAVPQVVADKVDKLQKHVKQVMKQAETHIPQVINHHIAQQKKQQVAHGVGVQVPQVGEQVPHGAQDVVAAVVEKGENVPVPQVPSHVQHVVEQAHTHIPEVINQHIASHKTPKTTKTTTTITTM